MSSEIKQLQYGCGFVAPVEWRNFDASPTLRFERLPLLGRVYTKNQTRFPKNVEYGDIVKGLPVENNFYDAVYCSHVLEHLTYEELQVALINTYKILRQGARFRLVMPDLEHYIKNYVSSDSDNRAMYFMKETLLGIERRNRGVAGLTHEWLGNSRHLWLWDFTSIKKELESAGFSNIRRVHIGDSEYVSFNEVEENQRWRNALGVECTKP